MLPEKVQQFYWTEDELRKIGGEQVLDLTSAEFALLEGASGIPMYLEAYNGFFALLQDD